MLRAVQIRRDSLFSSPEGSRFPRRIALLTDMNPYEADIDVVIGAHRQTDAVNATIRNYLNLEKEVRLHILVIESSMSIAAFRGLHRGANITRAFILGPVPCTYRWFGGRFWASNGAALAAQLGHYLGTARYLFFSHSDMMGCKENFLSFLLSKLDENTPLASFTQRHILPFTGGMLYDKRFIDSLDADWLPKADNPYHIRGMDQLRSRISHLNWIDTGEQLILASLERGKRAHVCASRGLTGDSFGHPLQQYGMDNESVRLLGAPIRYAPLSLSREEFSAQHPKLAGENWMWRKCFDDQGNLVFIHRGRGTLKGRREDQRGDFTSYVRDFNRNLVGPEFN